MTQLFAKAQGAAKRRRTRRINWVAVSTIAPLLSAIAAMVTAANGLWHPPVPIPVIQAKIIWIGPTPITGTSSAEPSASPVADSTVYAQHEVTMGGYDALDVESGAVGAGPARSFRLIFTASDHYFEADSPQTSWFASPSGPATASACLAALSSHQDTEAAVTDGTPVCVRTGAGHVAMVRPTHLDQATHTVVLTVIVWNARLSGQSAP